MLNEDGAGRFWILARLGAEPPTQQPTHEYWKTPVHDAQH